MLFLRPHKKVKVSIVEVVLGLTVLSGIISVFIELFLGERWRHQNDRGEKNCANTTLPHLLQAQPALALL